MEYTVPFHSEISGDVVPLRYISEAMARKAASGFGKRTLHGPTLQNARTQYESLLLSAAREGRLKVCGSHGNMGAVDDLVNAAEGLSNEWSDAVKAILALHVKPSHLNDWAMTNGDVFHLIDVPADVLEYGPTRPDGTKEYRGYAPWPFECFGGHGYFDAGQDGIPIELADDDFETDGFVKVAGAAAAVAKFLLSKGSPNKFQAERDAWPHILTGVVKGVLHPISPETLTPLSVEHCGNGMVPFSELVAWGQTTKLFAFRKVGNAAAVEPVKVGAGATAKGGRKPGPARELLKRILDELEKWAAAAGEPFDRRRMPGQVGEGPDDAPGFHWLCAEIDGHVFRRAKATFEKHREGLCTFAGWAKESDFYRRALPHIAPKFASGNKAAKLPVGKRKAA